jgi:hypothetical protein
MLVVIINIIPIDMYFVCSVVLFWPGWDGGAVLLFGFFLSQSLAVLPKTV